MPLNGRRRKKVPLSAEGPRREEEEEKKNEKIRRKELHLKTGRMNRAAIYEIGQAARAVGLAVRAFFLSFFLQRPRVASQRPASKQASKQAGRHRSNGTKCSIKRAPTVRTTPFENRQFPFCLLAWSLRYARATKRVRRGQLHRLERCIKMHEVGVEFREIPRPGQPGCTPGRRTQWIPKSNRVNATFLPPLCEPTASVVEIISGLRTRKWSLLPNRPNGSSSSSSSVVFPRDIASRQLSNSRSREITLDPLS